MIFERHGIEDIRHIDVVPHETSAYARRSQLVPSPTTYGMPDRAARCEIPLITTDLAVTSFGICEVVGCGANALTQRQWDRWQWELRETEHAPGLPSRRAVLSVTLSAAIRSTQNCPFHARDLRTRSRSRYRTVRCVTRRSADAAHRLQAPRDNHCNPRVRARSPRCASARRSHKRGAPISRELTQAVIDHAKSARTARRGIARSRRWVSARRTACARDRCCLARDGSASCCSGRCRRSGR